MTATLRTLRRSRGLTLTDLALLTGIPARNLGAIELGALTLDSITRAQLASVLEVAPETFPVTLQIAAPSPRLFDLQRLTTPFAIVITTVALTTSLLSHIESLPALHQSVESPSDPPAASVERLSEAAPVGGALSVAMFVEAILDTATDPQSRQEVLPPLLIKEPSTPVVEPTSVAPAMTVGAKLGDRAAPRGYPLIAPVGQIVVTQGYGKGTHAPATIWGALDFAIDSDGDGYAEPGATRSAPVIATHDGIARVYPGSWPGGNFVRIENRETGWITAYGHLESIMVSEGQVVQRGAQIGTVGSTGYATGPHLHYEIWWQGINIDPTPFVFGQ
jgi:transcriptional regulator with XRE-family HTH domain